MQHNREDVFVETIKALKAGFIEGVSKHETSPSLEAMEMYYTAVKDTYDKYESNQPTYN